jgi:hypothetical protein
VRNYDGLKCGTSWGVIFQLLQNPALCSISAALRISVHVSAWLSSRNGETIPCLCTKSQRRIGDADVTPHSFLCPLLVGWTRPHLAWRNSLRYLLDMWLVRSHSNAGHKKIVNAVFGIRNATISSIIRRHLCIRSA